MNIKDVEGNLKSFLEEVGESLPITLEKIILFGSYSRGEQKVGSDIDIALVSNISWEPKVRALVRDVLDDFSDNISVFCTTFDAIENAKEIFDANYWIKKEGVVLWEK